MASSPHIPQPSPTLPRGGVGEPGGGRPRVGISACLLGEPVRWNGEHRRHAYVTEVLAPHVVWVPVCPEVEIGLGTPRPPIRLERRGGAIHLVAPASGADHSRAMARYAARRLAELPGSALCGYILKRGSPSCGKQGVPVVAAGAPVGVAAGAFAAPLAAAFPSLPVVEEADLDAAAGRESFVLRLFTLDRWHQLEHRGVTGPRLRRFHARHEALLRAHDARGTRRLGRWLQDPRREREAPASIAVAYLLRLARLMERPPSREGHLAVLEELAEGLAGRLAGRDRRRLAECLEAYAEGLVPRVVPATLLRDHAGRVDRSDLCDQVYLSPHPGELELLSPP